MAKNRPPDCEYVQNVTSVAMRDLSKTFAFSFTCFFSLIATNCFWLQLGQGRGGDFPPIDW